MYSYIGRDTSHNDLHLRIQGTYLEFYQAGYFPEIRGIAPRVMLVGSKSHHYTDYLHSRVRDFPQETSYRRFQHLGLCPVFCRGVPAMDGIPDFV